MVAAASARTAADTTAILPNFSIMTRSCYFSGGEPALGLEFANRDVKQGASWDFRAAISRYRPIWLSRGPSDGSPTPFLLDFLLRRHRGQPPAAGRSRSRSR